MKNAWPVRDTKSRCQGVNTIPTEYSIIPFRLALHVHSCFYILGLFKDEASKLFSYHFLSITIRSFHFHAFRCIIRSPNGNSILFSSLPGSLLLFGLGLYPIWKTDASTIFFYFPIFLSSNRNKRAMRNGRLVSRKWHLQEKRKENSSRYRKPDKLGKTSYEIKGVDVKRLGKWIALLRV